MPIKRTTKQRKSAAAADSDDEFDLLTFVDAPEAKATKAAKAAKPEYQRLELHAQILKRPDTYIESTKEREVNEWVVMDGQIQRRMVNVIPGLVNIFQEIMSNAIDNTWRSSEAGIPLEKIEVSMSQETGVFSIWNDGQTIPIEKHPVEKLWNPELIFGVLLTSSNYNDEEERKTSGRNGYGAKLTNIFSKTFTIETYDAERGVLYTQTWKNNMHDREEPVIVKKKLRSGYTKITWLPDYKRFGVDCLNDDIINVVKKYVYDSVVSTKVATYLNGKLLPFRDLTGYSKCFKCNAPMDESERMSFSSPDSEVVIIPWNSYETVSFVNGKYTCRGGVHVDAWTEALFRPIVNKINAKGGKKKKRPAVDIRDVKRFFCVFVACSLDKPEFSGQTKDELVAPGVKTSVHATKVNKIMKWGFTQKIEDIIRMKEFSALKKTTKKKKGATVEGLENANLAGSAKSHECCLVVTEGLSAKTFVVKGMKKGFFFNGKLINNRDRVGILPLRGKPLNPNGKSVTSIAKNKEVTALIGALGLQYGVDYTVDANFRKLRYGGIGIVTDADVDGDHIKGLVMNIFKELFPSLMNRDDNFFVSMLTPIARVLVTGKKDPIVFYDELKFKKFVSDNTDLNFKVKYYKGLGTSEDKEITSIYGDRMVEYCRDVNTDATFAKVFHKTDADVRKKWLDDHDPEGFLELDEEEMKKGVEEMSFSDFLNYKMILYSKDHCMRSIPAMIDGFKQSHRKIIYSCIKKKLTKKAMKCAQLAGYVAEHSNYHHGEQCLHETINGLVARYVGSNNLPLLSENGQFGTRGSGGKDAAAARYTHTKLEETTDKLFLSVDNGLVPQVIDDGDAVEPEHYLPVVPLILINGCKTGIGTGWSSYIPCYNPLDVIRCVKICIENNGNVITHMGDMIFSELPDITPWYMGFKGTIVKTDETTFVSQGIFERIAPNKVKVTELPIGMWTENFLSKLESWKSEKVIKGFKNNSDAYSINFEITEHKDGMVCNLKTLGLTSNINTSNMVAYNMEGKIVKYTIEKIFEEFYTARFSFYTARKVRMLKDFADQLQEASNKYRFIREIIDKELDIMNRDDKELDATLEERNYDKRFTKKKLEKILAGDDEDEVKGGFEYLKRMPVWSFTKQKLAKLIKEQEDIKAKISETEKKSEKEMWTTDLVAFETAYKKWLVKQPVYKAGLK